MPENTPGYVIGTLSTIDDDAHVYQNAENTFRYVVVSDWETFTIVGNELIVKSPLNYETQATYVVSVRSQDTSENPKYLIKDFSIFVDDVNESPSKIELLPTQVIKDMFTDK